MVGRNASQVTRNRIDRPGTAEEAWDEWAGLKHLPPADPLDWPSVVIVAAHPDDEVLGAGGTMAMLAAAGTRMRLIAVTDEVSHPAADPEVIARVRTGEPAAARDVLGARDADVVRAVSRTAVSGAILLRQQSPACHPGSVSPPMGASTSPE